MNPTIHWATTVRILTQLRRDRRAMFMILVVPALITVLFHATLSLQGPGPDGLTPYDRLGIFQIAVIPCAVMFPIAAITMRRERAAGTLDRLFTTPLSKLDLLAGYGTAFALGALAQAAIVTLVAYRVTELSTQGSPFFVAMVCVLTAVLGVALGLFFSAFAETEFQAVQFAPIVLVPQLFLAGVFIPRDEMPGWLKVSSSRSSSPRSSAAPPRYADRRPDSCTPSPTTESRSPSSPLHRAGTPWYSSMACSAADGYGNRSSPRSPLRDTGPSSPPNPWPRTRPQKTFPHCCKASRC
jgi:ABC-2 type transport system permease protein